MFTLCQSNRPNLLHIRVVWLLSGLMWHCRLMHVPMYINIHVEWDWNRNTRAPLPRLETVELKGGKFFFQLVQQARFAGNWPVCQAHPMVAVTLPGTYPWNRPRAPALNSWRFTLLTSAWMWRVGERAPLGKVACILAWTIGKVCVALVVEMILVHPVFQCPNCEKKLLLKHESEHHLTWLCRLQSIAYCMHGLNVQGSFTYMHIQMHIQYSALLMVTTYLSLAFVKYID